ncbi:Ig-like domain-containing protein [Anaerosporobacter sp.]|uniref:Ig-like domain-containing protein n=1 Tax=Anaerosporobacter sp. TaxID=1872529 RepID=UPI00286EFF13|nr:Ig-like domain-containing protein [Anaerosporobacter sp.]
MKFKRIAALLFVITVTIVLSCFGGTLSLQAAKQSSEINKQNVYIYTGETCSLKISNTTGKITWSSTNKKVATVNANGKVTAKKVGDTTIVGVVKGKTYKCEIHVVSKSSDTIYIDLADKKKSYTASVGQKINVYVSSYPRDTKFKWNCTSKNDGDYNCISIYDEIKYIKYNSIDLYAGIGNGTCNISTNYKGKTYAVEIKIHGFEEYTSTYLENASNPIVLHVGDNYQIPYPQKKYDYVKIKYQIYYPEQVFDEKTNKNIVIDEGALSVDKKGKVTANKFGTGTVSICFGEEAYAEYNFIILSDYENEIIASNITSEMSDYEKAKALHDFVCSKMVYKTDYFSNYKNDMPCWYFCLVNGGGVCQNYTVIYQRLLNAVNIPCIRIISDSMNHTWNYVKIEDEWLHVDTTWDDKEGKEPVYTYFMLRDEEIRSLGRTDWYKWY